MKNESQYGLLLLQQYLYEHTDDQHPASVADILAFWREHGIQAGRKSVYSAIEVLQSNGMDIVCVKSTQNRYFVGERLFELPELKLLVDAVESSRFITAKKSEQLIEKLQKQKKEFCIIKDGTEQVKLLYKDILYLYKSKGAKYVNYVTTQGVVRERTSLENALKMLNSRQFLLVERGYAVNIKQICRVSGDTIYLEKGYEVPVSKARLAEVKREINLYWRNS